MAEIVQEDEVSSFNRHRKRLLCQKSRFLAQTFTPYKSTACLRHKSVPK